MHVCAIRVTHPEDENGRGAAGDRSSCGYYVRGDGTLHVRAMPSRRKCHARGYGGSRRFWERENAE